MGEASAGRLPPAETQARKFTLTGDELKYTVPTPSIAGVTLKSPKLLGTPPDGELGCDEDKERFERKLGQIATAQPRPPKAARARKRTAAKA
jgi:hypothetical protein